ncbi:MAG: DUF4114 domain-containing protein [Oscillatoriophycideae cyanobacterium NC_groundwater_1537_Pr4_S-0.65um_50_18]|nr:DUF4114 domain-containing protein [Oscillatoriophycideae cyanobacterium NC_groundwater_1537_Pr4_S-0.65um_50_18]
MNIKFLTGLLAAVAMTGSLLEAAPASAFSWNNSWTQSPILSKAQTGFDDTPFQAFVQPERMEMVNVGQLLLDPTKLKLKADYEVKVHFINEGASYRNQLAYEATGTTNRTGLIFNDTSDDVLGYGDRVNLGLLTAGTQLDFWLRADGKNRGDSANIFGTKTTSNADQLQHVFASSYKNYLVLGFEDLYGALGAWGQDPNTGLWNESSDRDFNDAVFVVDLGEENIKALNAAAVPEPSITLGLLGMGAAGLTSLRRRQKSAVS